MAKVIEETGFRNKIHIFRDRFHAGEMLAQKLKPYMGYISSPIVLAIPSGGVPVGETIAKKLGIPMDLIIVGLTRLTPTNRTQHNFNIQPVQTYFESIKLCKNKSVP